MGQTRRQYIRELKPYLITATLLLMVAVLSGSLLATHSPFARVKIGESLGGFAQMFLDLPKPVLGLMIFVNNAIKTLLAIVLGIAFGIAPLVFIFVNGLAIGVVLVLSINAKGLMSSMLAIVPHGVFELPGVLLGAGVGLMLGSKAIRRLLGKSELKIGPELRRALRFFADTLVPLLFIGALTEAYVTAALVGK